MATSGRRRFGLHRCRRLGGAARERKQVPKHWDPAGNTDDRKAESAEA